MRCYFFIIAYCSILWAGALHGAELEEHLSKLDSSDPMERETEIRALKDLGWGNLKTLRNSEGIVPLSVQANHLHKRIYAENCLKLTQLPILKIDNFKKMNLKNSTECIHFSPEKQILFIPASFRLEQGVLEYLFVNDNPNAPLHETLLSTPAKPSEVCLALLACGYEAAEQIPLTGGPMQKNTGFNISVQFEFETPHAGMVDDDSSRRQELKKENPAHLIHVRVPVEVFIFNSVTQRGMRRAPFIFTGSSFIKNPTSSDSSILAADLDGLLIALKEAPDALINSILDSREIDPQKRLGYQVDRYVVPARGKKCFLVLEPAGERNFTPDELKDTVK